LERIPVSIGGFHAKSISNGAVRHCNWFFVPDDSMVSIDTGCTGREYDECLTFFEGRF